VAASIPGQGDWRLAAQTYAIAHSRFVMVLFLELPTTFVSLLRRLSSIGPLTAAHRPSAVARHQIDLRGKKPDLNILGLEPRDCHQR